MPVTSKIVPGLQALAIPIESVVFDPNNLRKHGDKNLAAVRGSLSEYGQRKPIVVNKSTMHVEAGNATLQAALELGWTEIAAVLVDDDPNTALGYALADNRTAELAEWIDDAELAKSLTDLAVEDIELQDMVAALVDSLTPDEAIPVRADADADEVPEVNQGQKRAAPGDVWMLGRHRLMVGDSRSSGDVEKLLGGKKPFLMVTDPPYGVDYNPAWRRQVGFHKSKRMGQVENDGEANWALALRHFPGSVAYVWYGSLKAVEAFLGLQRAGLKVRAEIVWVKPKFVVSRGHYHWQHEAVFLAERGSVSDGEQNLVGTDVDELCLCDRAWYGVRSGSTAVWQGGYRQSTVWLVSYAENEQQRTRHGTQKPVELFARAMRNHKDAEGFVYDPFVGSGTCIIAAEMTGLSCLAMEVNPDYADVSIRRWEAFTGKRAEKV